MGRDRIFGVFKGYFVLKDRDNGCRGKKKAETLKSLPQDSIVLKLKSSTEFCSLAESPFQPESQKKPYWLFHIKG